MPRATKQWDKPHARIYAWWRQLPAWQTLSPFAKSLLSEMMMLYSPTAPVIPMTDRAAADVIPCARATAAKALEELEERGWITVVRVGAFCKRGAKRRGSAFRLNMQPFYNEPPSEAFVSWREL
jgi:hypothetical protein